MKKSCIYIILSLLTTLSIQAAWEIETVDGLPWLTPEFDCVIDSSGVIHGTFFDSYDHDLYYIRIIDDNWIYKLLTTKSNPGECHAINLDTNSNVHILHSQPSGNSYELIYSTVVNNRIVSKPVYNAPERFIDCDIVIAPGGQPHIVLEQNKPSEKVQYGTLIGNDWEFSLLPESGSQVTIALSNAVVPVICMQLTGNRIVSLFTKTGSEWIQSNISDSLQARGKIHFKIDNSNRFHVSYFSRYTNTLHYAWKEGSFPYFQTIPVAEISYANSSHGLALSPDNRIHVVFHKDSRLRLFYENQSGSFDEKSISPLINSENLQIVSPGFHGDNMHALVFDADNEFYHHGVQTDTTWTFTETHHRQHEGLVSKCAIADNDQMHILYLTPDSKSLKYATQTDTGWIIETLLDDTCSPSDLFDIEIDTENNIHICIIPDDIPTLRHGIISPQGLELHQVSANELFKWDCNIEIDHQGKPHIFTVQETSNNLVQFSHNPDNWEKTVLESTIFRAPDTSIVFDAGGNLHICYYDTELLYKKNGQPPTFIADYGVFNSHQIAVDSSGKPWISYTDSQSELILAGWTGNFWRYRTVSSHVADRSEQSLLIDSNNVPHIAYKSQENNSLVFTWLNEDEDWIDVTVDSTGDTGNALTLFQGSDLNHRLVYSNGKLKFAVQDLFVPPTPTPRPEDASGCTINVSRTWFTAGDLFQCGVTAFNNYSLLYEKIPLFVIFEIGGSFYFAPGFSDFEHYTVTLAPFQQQYVDVYSFYWPVGAGTYSGARIYAGMTTPDYTSLWGSMDEKTFGWGL